ncbi:MAG: uracil-DNA glycosylase [Nitrospirota bacterium]
MSSSLSIDFPKKEILAWLNWYRDMGVVALLAEGGRMTAPVGRGAYTNTVTQDMPTKKIIPSVESSLPQQGTVPSLENVSVELGNCQRCKLAPTRTHIVFGSGNPKAKLMFVGEAPGADEDAQGMPFVGRAGQLLTKMIIAMGLSREEVYIANIVKCRPPNNRPPEKDEIATCQPFLMKQIEAISPEVVCALGTFSAQTLLSSDARISDLRGQFFELKGTNVKVLPTFHPAYLLRSPGEKKKTWEDLQKIMAVLSK